MRSIDEIVALNIFMRMEDLNMSQKNLAILTGLTKDHINKLVKGRKSVSKSTSLAAIAKALHVDEVDLYQDPDVLAKARAREQSDASHISDLKKMNRMFSDQLLETVADLKVAQASQMPDELSAQQRELIDLFDKLPLDSQKAVLDFARDRIKRKQPKGRKVRTKT